MIYCIWYPSGGFGHFINGIISLYGERFCRPTRLLSISENGNSHSLPLVLPKYKTSDIPYKLPEINQKLNYTVLIDNGINDESQDFLSCFPESTVIKICYDDEYWPVVAHTHITKALNLNFSQAISPEPDKWSEKKDWAQREKFFLYLRDHSLRHQWRPTKNCQVVSLDQLTQYDAMIKSLRDVGLDMQDFSQAWGQWWEKNQIYFSPVIESKKIISAIETNTDIDISHITDIWTQAVVYYFIWIYYDLEIRHNDFLDFFSSTSQIKQCLKL